MKTVSVRDLRYDFPKVEELLRCGEEIHITKRRRVIARLTPSPDRSLRAGQLSPIF
jgi:antitoxin (DNA-binding transcriptional repressor) of toxin-antitoxin stability system